MKMPEALANAATKADRTLESALMTAIPTPRRPYSDKVLKNLVQAAAKASMLFGAPVEVEIKDASRLPPDLVRTLAMLEQAAADYGSPFPVSIREAQTDDALVAIAAHLLALVKDQGFQDFLTQDAAPEEGMEEGMEESMPEEESTPEGGEVEVVREEQEDDGEVEGMEIDDAAEQLDLFRRRMAR